MRACKECGGQGSVITDISKGIVVDCPVCKSDITCKYCASPDVSVNEESPEDRPYIIRVEYDCGECKAYWYEEY